MAGLGPWNRDECGASSTHPPHPLHGAMQYGWGALMKNQFYGDRNVEVCSGG